MIDTPDWYRPDHRPLVHAPPEPGGTRPGGTTAGAMRSSLVHRAVHGLRELERRRLRARFRAAPADPVPMPGGAVDEEELLSGLLAELRAGTTMQVCALRARGLPPEQVLCAVKATLRDVMAAEGWSDAAAVEPLMRRVVRWSIEAYYDR